MIIDSRLIWSSSLHALTKAHVGNRDCEKHNGYGYPKNIFHNSLQHPARGNAPGECIPSLKLHHDGHVQPVLVPTEIGSEAINKGTLAPLSSSCKRNPTHTARITEV